MDGSPPHPDAAPRLSPPGRLIGVILRPVDVMKDLRARPSAWLPLLVTLLLTNVILAVGFGNILDGIIDQIYTSSGLPDEEVDRLVSTIDANPGMTQTLYHVGVSLQLLVSVVVWAGLFHLSASTFFQPPVNRDPPTFRHSLAQVAHANLVSVFGVVGVQVLTALRDPPTPGVNLALLLQSIGGFTPESPGMVAAAWVGPVNFWWIGLLGVACAVNYQVPLRRALVVPIGVSLVFRTIQVILAVFAQATG